MTNTNSHGEIVATSDAHGESHDAPASELTGTYSELMAARANIDARLKEIETIEVPAMRARWEQEAAGIGKTIDGVLGLSRKKPGMRGRAKRED